MSPERSSANHPARRVGERLVRFVRSPRVRRGAVLGGLALLTLLLVPLLALARYVYFDTRNLPDIGPFLRFELPTTGHVYDRRGAVIFSLAHQYRRQVSYDDVPVILRQAILATEDKNFFSHGGVDYSVMPRVLLRTATRSVATGWKGDGLRLRLPQGGSTLTQQLVRGYFLEARTSQERGEAAFRPGAGPWLLASVLGGAHANKLLRKLEEVRLTLWVEREMLKRFGTREEAKREIFGRYASFIYMGSGRYGFAAASEYYFDKALSTLTPDDVGEAALLAGIAKSPRDYAPVEGDPRPLRRRNEILRLMTGLGYITGEEEARAAAEPIQVAVPSSVKTNAPGAIGHVLSEMKEHGGGRFSVEDLIQGRVSVHSTLDERVQAVVNEALETGLASYEKRHPGSRGVIQGSVVVLRNRDGGVLAEAGGRQVFRDRAYAYYDFNRVTSSLRQPGSAWKPLVYLAAFRVGFSLDSQVPDEPISVPTGDGDAAMWIANHDGRYKGSIPIRQALAESRNTVAVWITLDVGLSEVIRTARELGVRSPQRPYLSTALGASEVRLLELANVYRALASGTLARPHVIESVRSASGTVLYTAAPPSGKLRPAGLREIQEGLRGVVRVPGGTANALDRRDFPIPVMGKTGTTNDYRDALFVGSTYGPEGITVAVRIGFDDNRTLGAKESGGRTALPVFRQIMLQVYGSELTGPVPTFPREMEAAIDTYILATRVASTGGATPHDSIEPAPHPWRRP